MAISNCYYRLILKITTEFSTYRVVAKVRAKSRNKPYTQTVKKIFNNIKQ